MIRSAHFRIVLIVLAGAFAVPSVLNAQVGAPRPAGEVGSRTDSATASEVRTIPINPRDTVTKATVICVDGTRPARRDRHACDKHGGTRATVYTHTTNSANLMPTTGASAAATDSASGHARQRDSTREATHESTRANTDSTKAAADSLAAASAASPPAPRRAKADSNCGKGKSEEAGKQQGACDQRGGRTP
jgi:hypothetical protein